MSHVEWKKNYKFEFRNFGVIFYLPNIRFCVQTQWSSGRSISRFPWSDWKFYYPSLDGMLVHRRITLPRPQHKIRRNPFIHQGGVRRCEIKVSLCLDQNSTQWLRSGLKVPITFFLLFSYLKLYLFKITSAKTFCDLNKSWFFYNFLKSTFSRYTRAADHAN